MRLSLNSRASAVFRAVTLACFFYFSCLNNGFTYFIVSQGKSVPLDVTPNLVRHCVDAVSPVVWTKSLKKILFHDVYHKSTRVVGIASQRAVQQMLIESSLFQTWVKSSLKTQPSKADAASLRKSSHELTQSAVSVPAPIRREALNASSRIEVLKESTDYLKSAKMISHTFSIPISGSPKSNAPPIILALFIFVMLAEKLRRWHSSSISRGGSDLLSRAAFFQTVSAITLFLTQGDFYFGGTL